MDTNESTNETQAQKTDFKTVFELAQSQAEKETLSKIKDDLDLRDFDSLWSIVGILQMYLRLVADFNAATKESVKSFSKNGSIIQTVNLQKISSSNYFFLAAAILLFGSVTFVAGALLSGTSPAWLTGTAAPTSPLEKAAYLVLNAPAGWMLCLILSVPSFFYIKTYYSLFKTSRQRKERMLNLLILILLICLVLIALVVFIKLMYR